MRVIHPPGQVIGEHRHDWPFLMLPTLGDCVERHEAGEVRIGSPSAVMHPAGTCHANCIGRHGMESVSIEFDPDWVRTAGLGTALQRSRSWVGGSVALAARSVTLAWENTGASEREVARATGAFLRLALAHEAHARPRWLAAVQAMLDADDAPPTGEIARRLSLHPAWLARSYRRAVGEGLHATVRRKRVERAMLQLRGTDAAPADIAVASGFCDQSHMIRGFRSVLGRTPLEVRAERALLAGFEGTGRR